MKSRYNNIKISSHETTLGDEVSKKDLTVLAATLPLLLEHNNLPVPVALHLHSTDLYVMFKDYDKLDKKQVEETVDVIKSVATLVSIPKTVHAGTFIDIAPENITALRFDIFINTGSVAVAQAEHKTLNLFSIADKEVIESNSPAADRFSA